MSEMSKTPSQQTASPVTQAATLAKTPIGSADDVHRLVGAIERIMDSLDNLMDEETALMKEGKLNEAMDLVEAKNQLSVQYMLLQKAITTNASVVKQLAPTDAEKLMRRHYMFQNTLQANLAVLATVREVSKELIGSVNEHVQKGAKANIYGRSGDMPGTVKQARGIAIDTAS